MAIPAPEQLPIDVVVDGELYAQYFEPKPGRCHCLPSFTAGQHVTMVLGIADDEIFHTNTQIYQLDSAALAAARQVQDVDADIREGGRIDVHCAVSDDNDLLALSFAYDDNWVVTVNGEEVQPSALFGGLLGVSLPQGDCTVTLRYTHPGVVPGCSQPGRIGRRPAHGGLQSGGAAKMPDPLGSISPRLLWISKYAPARLRDLDGGILL